MATLTSQVEMILSQLPGTELDKQSIRTSINKFSSEIKAQLSANPLWQATIRKVEELSEGFFALNILKAAKLAPGISNTDAVSFMVLDWVIQNMFTTRSMHDCIEGMTTAIESSGEQLGRFAASAGMSLGDSLRIGESMLQSESDVVRGLTQASLDRENSDGIH